jgi:hypothetical protein
LPAGRFADLRFHFEVPDFAPEVRLAFTSTNAPGLVIDRLSVQPDPLGTLRGLGKVLNIAMGGAADGALPLMAYRPLLEVARQYAREEKWSRAFRLYSAAADLRPEDAAPIEGLETIYRYMTDDQRTAMGPRFTQVRSAAPARAPHLARALFQQGMEMRGYRVSATAVARGGELGLNLYWLLRDADADPRKYAIWVHFVDAGGQVVFQGDHNLTLALRKRWHTPAAVPSFFTIPIPPDVPAGTYAIRLGVYSPQNGERLRVVDTNMKHGKRSVTLPVEIVVH